MKYTSNRKLNHMWAELYEYFYELNKRERWRVLVLS